MRELTKTDLYIRNANSLSHWQRAKKFSMFRVMITAPGVGVR
jgi:hypothetical protein